MDVQTPKDQAKSLVDVGSAQIGQLIPERLLEINTDELDLSIECNCILGLAFKNEADMLGDTTGWLVGLKALKMKSTFDERPVRFGLQVDGHAWNVDTRSAFRALTEAWVERLHDPKYRNWLVERAAELGREFTDRYPELTRLADDTKTGDELELAHA